MKKEEIILTEECKSKFETFCEKVVSTIKSLIKIAFIGSIVIAIISCIGQGYYLTEHAKSAIHEIEAYLLFILATLLAIFLKIK
tara:strand:- start:811 stop:1062 length:252 start_codon:yes stop_codon:yes gene_type:complete